MIYNAAFYWTLTHCVFSPRKCMFMHFVWKKLSWIWDEMSFSGRFFPFFVLVSVLKTIINIYLSHFSSNTFHIHMQIPRHRTNFTYTCEKTKQQPHRRSFVSDDPASFGDYYTSLIIVISVHVRFQQMHQVCGLSGHSKSKRVFSNQLFEWGENETLEPHNARHYVNFFPVRNNKTKLTIL